ncbi:unnamed protein product [Knipowitschia caucasica]|uniref:G domain-containing protein n=1 Tax=Knipowitschia caucasica TaxID=637954 RepID=A0AAV2KA89_KNICA
MLPGIRTSVAGLRLCVGTAARRWLLPSGQLPHSRLRSLCSRSAHNCTVDPGAREDFVFVDCVETHNPKTDHSVFGTDLVHLPSDLVTPPDPVPAHRKKRVSDRKRQTLQTTVNQDYGRNVDHPRPSPGQGLVHHPEVSPEPGTGLSSVPCYGCGAPLQTVDPMVPGYLLPHHFYQPQEPEMERDGDQTKVHTRVKTKPKPSRTLCQRCHQLTHHHQILQVTLNQEHFREIISGRLRSARVLVLLVVDLVDLPDSIIPDLGDLVGADKQVSVVGTKLDLLPVLSSQDVSAVKRRLQEYVCSLTGFQALSVSLVSAQTGYGVEELVSTLHRVWRHKGDVVLVGSANAGKSTLFNALLESDYNRLSGSRRATVSPWPGTTLNLLKFPILNPTPARLLQRHQRLKKEALLLSTAETDEGRGEGRGQLAYVTGDVGRTFKSVSKPQEISFDPDLLAFGETEDGLITRPVAEKVEEEELAKHHVKDAHWLYDTPGIIKDQDMLKLLTEQEVRSVVPVQALVPRTFVLKPGSSLFVGGLLRIDFISGPRSAWFSVLASGLVPVHVSTVERAESVYEKHAGERLLGVTHTLAYALLSAPCGRL